MRAVTAFAVVALALGTTPAAAQDYPVREIKTICPFAPGTGADIVVRFYANKLADLAGKPVVTENKPGAQGMIGTEAIVRAKPDGYTVGFNPVASTMAAAPHIFKKMPFDPMKDVEPVAMMLSVNFVLVVDPKRGFNTLADLTKHLKEKNGDAFYGGSTNTGIVASELTLGDLGTRDGLLGGVNAVIVGNYLTTLGREPEEDLELLSDLKMPIKELSKTL